MAEMGGRNTWLGIQDRTGRKQSEASKQKHEGNGRGLPVDEPEATMTDTRTSWLMTANGKASKQKQSWELESSGLWTDMDWLWTVWL